MEVLILAGDGICGWLNVLRSSKIGQSVVIVDNLSDRKIDVELEEECLTPIASMFTRLNTWLELTGKKIGFNNIDVAHNYQMLLDLICNGKVDAIIHFAEQRASMPGMSNEISVDA